MIVRCRCCFWDACLTKECQKYYETKLNWSNRQSWSSSSSLDFFFLFLIITRSILIKIIMIVQERLSSKDFCRIHLIIFGQWRQPDNRESLLWLDKIGMTPLSLDDDDSWFLPGGWLLTCQALSKTKLPESKLTGGAVSIDRSMVLMVYPLACDWCQNSKHTHTNEIKEK